MAECEWGRTDCKNLDDKCHLCVTVDYHYDPIKSRKSSGMGRSAPKESKRKGAAFELRNHHQNADMISGATTRMTPNSGAGQVKGDQEIQGIINIMEELKEQNNKETARGSKTFTIHKEWLTKLNREAKAALKEFWYLKFSFAKSDHDTFIVVESDTIMSMVYTMIEDRKNVTKYRLDAELAEKRRQTTDVANTLLYAQIEELKAEIAVLKHEKDLG